MRTAANRQTDLRRRQPAPNAVTWSRTGLDPPDRIVDREADGDDGEHAEAG
jgi:hypothetical protein